MAIARRVTRGSGEKTQIREIRNSQLPQIGLLSNVDSNPVNINISNTNIISSRINSNQYPSLLGLNTTNTPSWGKGSITRGIGFSGNGNPISQTNTFKSGIGSINTTTISLINVDLGLNAYPASAIIMAYQAQWRIFNPSLFSVFNGFASGIQNNFDFIPEKAKNYWIYESSNEIKSPNFVKNTNSLYGLKTQTKTIDSLTSFGSLSINFNQSQIRISPSFDFIYSVNYFQPNWLCKTNIRFIFNIINSKINKFTQGV